MFRVSSNRFIAGKDGSPTLYFCTEIFRNRKMFLRNVSLIKPGFVRPNCLENMSICQKKVSDGYSCAYLYHVIPENGKKKRYVFAYSM